MTTKRKISARKILQAVVTLVLTGGCVAAILGASEIQQTEKLQNVFIHVKNEKQFQFLDKQTLLKNIIDKNHLVSSKTKIGSLNLKSIEQQVYKNPWVADAQVYIDNQRNMHIYAIQHTPSARIFFENGQSAYINNELKLLPTSDKFTLYTTVVTNVPWFNNDSLNKVARAKVVSLVRTVEKDSFWNAQIEQISMTPDMEFEIYPVLGTHKILLGDTALAERKFENLFGFYKNILNKIGWDKYQILDARFNDQIVASPALAWKMPPKGFISNMDWVKTIMGDEKNAPKTAIPQLNTTLTNNTITTTTSQTITSIPLNNNPATTTTAVANNTNPKPVTVPKTTSPKTKTATSKPSTNPTATTTKPSTGNTTVQAKPKPSTNENKSTPKATTNETPAKTKTAEPKKEEDAKPKYILN